MNARPHPGPLPQERMNRAPLSDDTDAHSGRPSRPAQAKEAAIATVGENFPCAAAPLSLSPGERVNHPPLSDDADTPGGRRCAGLKHKAATAKWSKQFSSDAARLSLSP